MTFKELLEIINKMNDAEKELEIWVITEDGNKHVIEKVDPAEGLVFTFLSDDQLDDGQ